MNKKKLQILRRKKIGYISNLGKEKLKSPFYPGDLVTRKGESERSVLYPKDSQIIQESWHMYPSPLSSHLKVIEHPGDLQDV